MITKIEINNINAIDNCQISFNKGKYQYHEDMLYNDQYVNPIAFYGTNGSGKSSFLKAFAQLVAFLIEEPDKLSPFIPRLVTKKELLNDEKKAVITTTRAEKQSCVKIFFTLDEVNYTYKIATELKKHNIVNEVLTANAKTVFERFEDKYEYCGKSFEIEGSLFPTLRALSSEQIDPIIIKCYNYLSNIAVLDASECSFMFKAASQKSYQDIIAEKSDEIKEILSTYHEFPVYDVFSTTTELGKKSYFARINTDDGDVFLPYSIISNGMKNQNVILSAMLTLPENGVMVIDEIENALHPLTILDFLNVIKKKHIQLIFSSHNTYILQKLRPDQIYFANWKNGVSTYKRLSDIYPNIREINNIEKMYLSNMFEEGIKNDE